jgi:hypothetical protein
MVARTIIVVAIAVGLSSVRSPVASIFLLMAAGNMAMSMLLFWQLRRLWREGG